MIIVNRQAQPIIEHIGHNKVPVVIIDNYAENHNDIIKEASINRQFKPDEVSNYPGIRSSMPKALVVEYLQPVMQALYGIFNFSEHLTPMPKSNYFSLITKLPEELSAMQSWPHFDTAKPTSIAVMHYLGNGEHGGIGFFRHKKTGIECVKEQQKNTYYQSADKFFKANMGKKYGYCSPQHSEFDCYKRIAYKPNRLIIFPGYLLHSSLVDITKDISNSPESGRLTANMFIDFQ